MANTRTGLLLVERFNRTVAAIVTRARVSALATWDGLDHYDEKDVAPFIATAVPFVLAVQEHVTHALEAYMATLAALETSDVDQSTTIGYPGYARMGVTPEDVYRRPFVTVWSELANGTRWDSAVAAGRARLDTTVAADVMLAHRDAATRWMTADSRVDSYRRVTSPTSCELCTGVAGDSHAPDRPMAIHPHCDCTIEPTFRGVTPLRLPSTQPRNNDEPVPRADLPPARIVEHGEMGAMLVNADQHFAA